MRIVRQVAIERSSGQVSEFFMDVHNLARWDRSVEKVEVLTPQLQGVGFRFDTVGPSTHGRPGRRMHYIVSALNPQRFIEAVLIEYPMFRGASWRMEFEPHPAGTLLTCVAIFHLRHKYAFLMPILWLSGRAITRDLGYLKSRIEGD